jgi:transcriptional regulator of nitric oxide reductase
MKRTRAATFPRSGLPAQSSVAQENAPRVEVSTPVFRPTNQPEETAMYAAPTLTVLILSQMSTAGQQRTDDGDPVSFTPAQVALNLGTEVEAERVQTRWSTLVKQGYITNLNITNLEHFGYITPRGQAFLKQVSPGTVH